MTDETLLFITMPEVRYMTKLLFVVLLLSLSLMPPACAKAGDKKMPDKISENDLNVLENYDLHIEKILVDANIKAEAALRPWKDKRAVKYASLGIAPGDTYDPDGTIHHKAQPSAPTPTAARPGTPATRPGSAPTPAQVARPVPKTPVAIQTPTPPPPQAAPPKK